MTVRKASVELPLAQCKLKWGGACGLIGVHSDRLLCSRFAGELPLALCNLKSGACGLIGVHRDRLLCNRFTVHSQINSQLPTLRLRRRHMPS